MLLYPFNINYDRIIHNIENIYSKRQDIGQANGKDVISLKIKVCIILKVNVSKHLECECEAGVLVF